MKLIITGATGFIGRNLAERLHEDGMEVLATGRSKQAGQELQERGIEFRTADLLDAGQLTAAFTPADCVVHCAGKSADWGDPAQFFEVNVLGTRRVIQACERHGIGRIIFISTPSLYFTGRDRFDISEADPLPERQLTPYARTKLAAEQELLAQTGKGCEVIILRPRAVFGPHDRTLAPRILGLAEKRRFPLIDGGRAFTDITYIDNLVDAVRACLHAGPAACNTVYNISNGEPIRILDWFAKILEIFERPFRPRSVPLGAAKVVAAVMELASRLPFGPQQPSFTRFSVGYMATSMTMSIARAEERLGYVPRIGNREGFERYASWYHSTCEPPASR